MNVVSRAARQTDKRLHYHRLEHTHTQTEMIEYWGYPAEEHKVTTEDGYVLTLHRIPYGRGQNQSLDVSRTPVFLGHCLLCSSAVFAFGPPEQEIAYILADAGTEK